LKFADRFYYENGADQQSRFTREQLDQIRQVKFGRVLCDNVEVNYVQSNPFRKSHAQTNPSTSCLNFQSVDLTVWREGGKGLGKNRV
jgi:hypothetical protein